MGGAPRLPDEIKKQRGTFQACRSNPHAPPATGMAPREVPQWLVDEGADSVEIYSQLIMSLDNMRVLSLEDEHCVALAASALAEVRHASRTIVDEGRTYETRTMSGEHMKRGHPAVAQKADAMRRAQSLLMQMGLTPATRATVGRSMGANNNPFADLDG